MSNQDINGLVQNARKSMANFNLNAMIRGAQLTVVGGT